MKNLTSIEIKAVCGGVQQEDIRYCEVTAKADPSVVLAKFSYVDGTTVADEKKYQNALRKGMLDGKSVKEITDPTTKKVYEFECYVLRNE